MYESQARKAAKRRSAGFKNSDYVRNKENKKDDEKKDSLFEEAEDKKDEKLADEDLPFRAAKQVFNENRKEQQEHQKEHKKNLSSIEEAIKKAVEDEKKTIMLD